MRRTLRGLRNLSNWVMLLPIGLFFFMVQLFPQNKLAIITNGLDIGVWILVVRAYLPPFWTALRAREHRPETYLLGGVLLNSTALAMSRIWSLGIIVAGKPPWMINHWFQSFCYLLMALSYYYFLRVPKEHESRKYIAYALILGVVFFSSVLLFMEN